MIFTRLVMSLIITYYIILLFVLYIYLYAIPLFCSSVLVLVNIVSNDIVVLHNAVFFNSIQTRHYFQLILLTFPQSNNLRFMHKRDPNNVMCIYHQYDYDYDYDYTRYKILYFKHEAHS